MAPQKDYNQSIFKNKDDFSRVFPTPFKNNLTGVDIKGA